MMMVEDPQDLHTAALAVALQTNFMPEYARRN